MNTTQWERVGAGSGLASLVAGAAGGALERGWPSASDPVAVAAFMADKRAEILAQSMAFVLSAGLFLWFLASLRSFLVREEEGSGTLSALVFGAGSTWAALSMAAQAFQVGNVMAANHAEPALLWTMAAMFSIANLPLAVMLLANAVVCLRTRVFPDWLGWLSLVAASAQMALWFGTIAQTGPLAPNGWLTYVLYPSFALWLVPTAVVMVKRIGKPSQTASRTSGHFHSDLGAA